MRNIIVLEHQEIRTLEKGHALELTIAGQSVLVKFDRDGVVKKEKSKDQCPICGLKCSGPQGLGSHSRIHKRSYKHRGPSHHPTERATNKRFKCGKCTLSFSTVNGRSAHQSIHKKR